MCVRDSPVLLHPPVPYLAGWMPDAGTCLACMGILVNINAWCYM